MVVLTTKMKVGGNNSSLSGSDDDHDKDKEEEPKCCVDMIDPKSMDDMLQLNETWCKSEKGTKEEGDIRAMVPMTGRMNSAGDRTNRNGGSRRWRANPEIAT